MNCRLRVRVTSRDHGDVDQRRVCRAKLPAGANVEVILDVAKVAAHTVRRLAAPVTTFLLGVTLAGGMEDGESAAKKERLAANWPIPPQ
jgi:hypothetical protein